MASPYGSAIKRLYDSLFDALLAGDYATYRMIGREIYELNARNPG